MYCAVAVALGCSVYYDVFWSDMIGRGPKPGALCLFLHFQQLVLHIVLIRSQQSAI